MTVGYREIYELLFTMGRVPRAKFDTQRKWVQRHRHHLPEPVEVTKAGEYRWDSDTIIDWLRSHPELTHVTMQKRKPRVQTRKPQRPTLRQVHAAVGENIRRIR
jgi:hypothetical protein